MEKERLEIDSLSDKLAVAELHVEIEERPGARDLNVIGPRRQIEDRRGAFALHRTVHFDGRSGRVRRNAQRA